MKRIHSGVQRRNSKKNQFWTSKLTTNPLKPFNIHISTHAIHPAWKMTSLKGKQWDCLELSPQKQHLRRALWNSNNVWGHAATLKQSWGPFIWSRLRETALPRDNFTKRLYENCVTETQLTLLNYAYILRRNKHHLPLFLCSSSFIKYSCLFTFRKWTNSS